MKCANLGGFEGNKHTTFFHRTHSIWKDSIDSFTLAIAYLVASDDNGTATQVTRIYRKM